MMWSTSLNLEATLRVYRLKGNVTVSTSGTARKVQQRDEIKPSDILNIPDGGSIEILDSDSHRIYSSTTTGSTSVKVLLDKAADDASAITRKTNKKVLAAVAGNAASQRTRYGASGLSLHETDGVSCGLIALPSGISYLSYLMSLSAEDSYDDRHDIILMRRDYSENDATFNFAVFNTLDRPLYVNVIDQHSTDGNVTLYFRENPVTTPRSETLIPQYRYLLPVDRTGYIVIASDKDFTLDDVKLLLDDGYVPENDFFFSLLQVP